jgi:hypothetical protein
VRVGKRYTPGTFYTKLAVDRLLWDNLQQLVDPDYRGSFRRMEETLRKDTGQQFWWRPGGDLGAVASPTSRIARGPPKNLGASHVLGTIRNSTSSISRALPNMIKPTKRRGHARPSGAASSASLLA